MTFITNVSLWNDIGHLEHDVLVPHPDHELTDPDTTFDDSFAVPTTDLFTKLTIPEAFPELLTASYMQYTVNYNNSQPQTYFAWIDSVELKSDTTEHPVTIINHHIDLWRTYLPSTAISYGHIKSRPVSDNDPIQTCTYNYRTPDEFVPASYTGAGSDLYWVILTFTNESSDHKVTECRTMVAPVSKDSPAQRYTLKLSGDDTTIQCPSLSDFINGDYDEQYGISASSVSSVFISPVPPFDISEVDGTTVTINTTVTEESTTQSTQSGTMTAYHITALNLWGQRMTNNAAIRVIYSDDTHTDESITFRSNSDPSPSEWIRTHPGARGGNGMNATVANNAVSFLYYTSIDSYIRQCVPTLQPSEGAQFIIRAGYVGTGMSYTVSHEFTATGGNVTETVKDCERATNIVATYNGTNWISDRGTYICFTAESDGNWTYTTSSASTAYSVSLAQSSTAGYGYAYTTTGHYFEHRITLQKTVQTDNIYEYLFTDMSASPIGSVPWGIPIRDITARVIVSSVSAYVEYRCNGMDSHASGMCYVVPLPPVDLTSNSWSDYVYSGARDLDVQQKSIANQQALVSGIGSAISGGAFATALSPKSKTVDAVTGYERAYIGTDRTGTPKHLDVPVYGTASKTVPNIKAGLFTAGAGIATSAVEYAINETFNRKLQKATDIATAKQIDSMTVSGSGWDWMWNGQSCGFTRMSPDHYSKSRFENDILYNGVSVSEPTENIILTAGAWRIEEAVITGSVPVEAKTYIKLRLSTGVRIYGRE